MKQKIKKALSLLLSVSLILSMFTGINLYTVNAAISSDITLLNNQTLSTDTIGTPGGNITVTVPTGAVVIISGTQTIQGTVTFVGGGTFQRSSGFTDGSMFSVGSNATLNLGTSSNLTGITIDGNNYEVYANGGGINISGGTLNIYEGAHLTRNILNSASYNGGACFIDQGTINMYGGVIDYNQATSIAPGTGGGGIYVAGSSTGTTLNISDGVISYNKTGSLGGAICIHGSEINGRYAVMNMTGGTVTGNYAGRYGGAVEILSNSKLVMSGGRIIGNSVGKDDGGGGIEVDITNVAATYPEKGMYLSGNAEFTGNYVSGSGKQSNILLYVYNNLKLTNNFTGSAGVHLDNNNSLNMPLVENTSNYTGAENFFLDAGGYIGANGSGNIIWATGNPLSAPDTNGFPAPVVGTSVSVTPQGTEKATYQWYRSTTKSTNDTTNWISIPKANGQSYTPSANDVNHYLICVLDGTGGYTGQQKVITDAMVTTFTLEAPTAKAAVSTGSNGFTINWNKVTGATNYYVDVATDSGFTSKLSSYDNVLVGDVSYAVVSQLTSNTTYYYRVRATDGSNTSADSNIITVQTTTVASDRYQPLNVTSGFNSDIIAEAKPALSYTNAPFDSLGASDNNALYSVDYNATGGLPRDGKVTSASTPAVDYQLAPYDQDNALRLDMTTEQKKTGTLTFSTLGAYSKISVLGASASGAAFVDVTINYTDGSTTSQRFGCKEWFFMPDSVFSALGRVDRAESRAIEISGPRLYQYQVNTDAGKLIQSITFTESPMSSTEDGGQYTNNGGARGSRNDGSTTVVLMAVSGIVGSNAPVASVATSATNIQDDSFTATWMKVSGATTYTLDVATDADFTSLLDDYNNKYVGDIDSLSITGLDSGTTYYYRVRAVNSDGQSLSSNAVTVTTTGIAIFKATVIMNAPDTLTYNGLAQGVSAPTISGSSLTDTDYIITYTNRGGTSYNSTTAPSNAGDYTATFSLTNAGLEKCTLSANSVLSVDFSIGKKTVTITPQNNQNKFYGQTDSILTYTPSGNISGETPKFSGALSRAIGESTGNYVISQGSLALTDNDTFKASNYSLIFSQSIVNFEIKNYSPAENATLSNANIGNNGWYTGSVALTAPEGFQISTSNALSDNTWTSSIELDNNDCVDKNATYYLKNITTGAISEIRTSPSYNIDKTAPTGKITIKTNESTSFKNNILFDMFYKDTVDVSIIGNDALSTIDTIQYQKVASEADYNMNGTWITGSAFSVPSNEKFVVYAKITDKAGNYIIINSNGVVVYTDSSQATANISFTKSSTTDITADVTLNGNSIREIKNGSAVLVKDTDYTVSGQTITFKASYLDTLDCGNYTFTISYNPMGESYVDAAGNDAPATTTIALTVNQANQTDQVTPPQIIDDSQIITKVGESTDLSNVIDADDSGAYEYRSSNTDVVTVNPVTGELTIVGIGTATIYVKKLGDANHIDSTETSITINVNGVAKGATYTIPEGGSLEIPEGEQLIIDGTLIIDGSLDIKGELVNEGEIINNGDLVNDGIINNKVDAIINNIGTISNNSNLFNNGAIYNKQNAIIDNDGTISNNSNLINDGVINNKTDAIIDNDGTISNNSNLVNNGSINNKSDAIIDNNGNISNKGNLNNNGTINNNKDGKLINEGNIVNQSNGVIKNKGNINNSKSFVNNGSLENTGILKGIDSDNASNASDTPKTGDNSIPIVWLLALLLTSGLTSSIVLKKRNSTNH